MWHNENAGVENAGKENGAPDCRGAECGTGSRVENAGKVACVIKLKQHKVNDKRVK